MNRICCTTTFSRKLASARCVVVNQVLVTSDTVDFSVIILLEFNPRERQNSRTNQSPGFAIANVSPLSFDSNTSIFLLQTGEEVAR